MTPAFPLVSCLCLTYARPAILRESIWCFLQQDWPNKELVVLNDHPEPIYLDQAYPEIRVINFPARFANLGAKRNYSVQVARGEYVCLWDDDDLFLPWRLSTSMEQLLANPDAWAFKPTAAWFSTHNQGYRVARNLFHNQIAMPKQTVKRAGGYAQMNSGEDIAFEQQIPQDRWIRFPAKAHELLYVYRWGNNVTHISGLGTDGPGRPTAWERVAELTRQKQGGGLIRPGFDRDYWQDLAGAAAALPEVPPEEAALLAERLRPYHQLEP
ncbi:MAG TPA: glycosyltransferase family A protein [Symbiobacteriaceae bacterium]|nr:glycosyltransferase family A protein [Symbiobacteriaceae bacterium]